MANLIILGNKESELPHVLAEVQQCIEDMDFMGTFSEKEKIKVLKDLLKKEPFGFNAAMNGMSRTVIKFKDVKHLLNS